MNNHNKKKVFIIQKNFGKFQRYDVSSQWCQTCNRNFVKWTGVL